jgi:beta-lactamase regulating signal transducer with metallopeptidase domain
VLHLLIPLTGGVGLAPTLVALVATQVLHALLWTAVVAPLTHSTRISASARSWMWRMALFGPLLTTLLSATLWPVLDPQGSTSGLVMPGAVSALRRGDVAAVYRLGEHIWRWLVFAGAVALLLGLARFARAAWRIATTLRGSRPCADARSLRLLECLLSQTRLTSVRLTESREMAGPLSVGLGTICVPTGLLDGMSDAEVEAALSHEVAHLERRDGLWFPAVAFVEAVLWVSPFTHWAASRARFYSELACDDRAVALTERPHALARALAHVAEKALESQRRALLPSMAGSSGVVLGRVKRLVAVDAGAASPLATRNSRWAVACVAVLGCSVGAVRLALPVGEAPPRVAPLSATIEQELAALELGAREAQAELDAMLSEPEPSSSAAPPPRLLELQQELRHSRDMRAFLEAELRPSTATSEPDERGVVAP